MEIPHRSNTKGAAPFSERDELYVLCGNSIPSRQWQPPVRLLPRVPSTIDTTDTHQECLLSIYKTFESTKHEMLFLEVPRPPAAEH